MNPIKRFLSLAAALAVAFGVLYLLTSIFLVSPESSSPDAEKELIDEAFVQELLQSFEPGPRERRADEARGQGRLSFVLGIWYEESYYSDLAEKMLALEEIDIDHDRFLDMALVTAAYVEMFEGRKIRVQGIFRNTAGETGDTARPVRGLAEPLVGRISVTCCILDTELYGFPLLLPGGISSGGISSGEVSSGGGGADGAVYPDDTWVQVEGTVSIHEKSGLAAIAVGDIVPIEPPGSVYVYPRYYPEDAFIE